MTLEIIIYIFRGEISIPKELGNLPEIDLNQMEMDKTYKRPDGGRAEAEETRLGPHPRLPEVLPAFCALVVQLMGKGRHEALQVGQLQRRPDLFI